MPKSGREQSAALGYPWSARAGHPVRCIKVLKDPNHVGARVGAASESNWHMDDFRRVNRLARSAHPARVGGDALD